MILPEIYPKANGWIFLDHSMGGKIQEIQGITIHYTADRDMWRVMAALTNRRLGYHFIIDRDGSVIQTGRLNRTMSHAGKAIWQGYSPNLCHISISLVSWGHLVASSGRLRAWTGAEIPPKETALRIGNTSLKEQFWDKATGSQESALRALVVWICEHGLDPEAICGHDEACMPRGRKVDPGGVLSRQMSEFRAYIRRELSGRI